MTKREAKRESAMLDAIIIVGIIGFFVYLSIREQARQDEYYQEQAEAERQRAREHDIRMGRVSR